ncbi:MAG: FG-GAP-like repeat-containing protein, partial [Desulfobacterales bacterium]
MKRTIFHMIRNLLICASLVAGSWPAVAAAATQKVAVVPFTVYAEKDLAFLQKGIVDMLTSRLSQPGEVAVIGREATASALEAVDGPLNPESAVALGKKLGVDYVLFGSLTVFGESVSVDAKMLDVAGSKPPLSFYTQSASYGEVIPAIDRFAAQINEEVFGRKPVRAAAPAAAPAVAPAPAPAPEVPDTRTHPEKLIESGFGETEEGRTAVAGIEMGRPWKSRRFRELINGMDLGDVDADGRIETVLAATDKILIYRWENGRFLETARIEMPAFRSAIGVDVGDINGNGVEEIFVTALNNQKNSVQSIVYEFSGSGYQPIVETSSWYFRIVEQKAFGKRLF